MEKVSYSTYNFSVDYYENFLSFAEAEGLFEKLEESVVWRQMIGPKRKINQNYGDDRVTYSYYLNHNEKCSILVRPWKEIPKLLAIRYYIEILTSASYNYCTVTRYPRGRVGINPHRDKRVKSGTTIAEVSLGTTRTLILTSTRTGEYYELPLAVGSLYVLHHPANRDWRYGIKPEKTLTPHISLTYRLGEMKS